MVIVVLGVISAIAIPRLIDTNVYNQRGLYDQTIVILRYAQKTAIAQRRTVCVTFGANSATLTMATDAAVNGCASATPLAGPKGEVPAAVTGRGTAGYITPPTPAGLNFNGLGQPVDNNGAALGTQTITVTGGPADITVQAVTGYVQ